ncbi:MAG: ATP-binding cassette domain-containing protein [Anaerolineales bacterium]|jgi:putative ABC transport system ATP-binding protein
MKPEGTHCENKPILRVDGLTRVVGDKKLVDNISLEVCCCDVIAIVGPSGSGKSSLLRLLNRLDEPDGGSVYLEGRDYCSIPPRELRQQIGMVLQQPYLFPGTIADNIRFGPQQRGDSISDEQIEALLEQVALSGYGNREVSTLSGGEAQRVSVARTLANSPKILLLDEPTSALDQAAEKEVEQLLVRIFREQSQTCLIVTHDPDQARRMASKVMQMEGGRLVKFGSVKEVL